LGDLVAGEQGYTNLKKKLLKSALLPLFIITMFAALTSHATAQKVRQPAEVVEAYRVCNEFKRLLGPDINFGRAFDATFTNDPRRRREIAIAEGEFGDADLAKVEDATLIEAYKNRAQTLILLLPLLGVEDERSLPPEINEIFDRGSPRTAEEFLEFATQLKQDVANLRAHLKELAARNPPLAESMRKYAEELSKPLKVPTTYIVKPTTYYSKGRVLRDNEPYYKIDDFAVIRERGQMKLISADFFRLHLF